MTFALLTFAAFLVASIYDSDRRRKLKEKRVKVKQFDEVNIFLQEEIFLKWFQIISDEIMADSYGEEVKTPMSLTGAISRRYLEYGIPCWDSSNSPSLETKYNGKRLEYEALDIKLNDSNVGSFSRKDWIKNIKYKQAEKYHNITLIKDWRLWLVSHNHTLEGYKTWYNRDNNLIQFALFKDETVENRPYTRIEAILLNCTLRAYFLNLVCLLTKKELAEHKYRFTSRWDFKCGDSHLYVPTDEEASKYPWMFT